MDEIVARMDSGPPSAAESDSTLEQPPPKARGPRRSAAACQRCRRRKQKCDGQLPSCGACLTASIPCQPSSRVVITGSVTCHECHHLRQENARLKQLIDRLKNFDTAASAGSSPGNLDPRVSYLDDNGNGGKITVSESMMHPDILEFKQSRSPVTHNFIFRPTFRGTKNHSLARHSSPWYLWDGLSPSRALNTSSRLPGLVGTESYIELFFRSRWPQYPVIQRAAFTNEQYLPLSRGELVSDIATYQVYMVLAIASRDCSSRPASSSASLTSMEQPGSRHADWFREALRLLPSIFNDSDDSQIAHCLLLLCMYGLSEPQVIDLWYTIGLALRTAIGADLHRQTDDAEGDQLQVEMSRRLIWSLYAMDSTISIALGRPLAISESDILTPLPVGCLYPVPPVGGSSDAQDPSSQEDMSIFLHIVEIRKLKSAIHSSLYLTKVPDDSSLSIARLNLEARLDKWIMSCPPCVAVAPPSMYHTYEWQQVSYHQAILMLYRPSRAFPDSGNLRRCADSAVALINCYSALYSWNRISYTFLTHVALFMAAITLLYAIRLDVSLRRELPRDVVEYTIRSATHLLRKVSAAGQVGERAAGIVQNLSAMVLDDAAAEEHGWTQEVGQMGGERDSVNAKLVSWFGLPAAMPQEQQAGGVPQEQVPFSEFGFFPGGFLEEGGYGVDELLATYASTAF